MPDPLDPPVALTVDGPVATVTLDRPAKRNALTVELLESLVARLDEAVDRGARAVVLAASGPAFCAGLDLTETDPGRLRASVDLLLAAMRRILTAPVPVVARVHGPVRAGGLGLVTAADVAVAADDVTVAFTEVRLGLAPAVVSVSVLHRLRPADATRLFLTAENVTAREAVGLGLLDEAVEREDLDSVITSRLEPLLAAHPQGMRATKSLLTRATVKEIDARGEELAAMSAELFASEEARAAIESTRRRR